MLLLFVHLLVHPTLHGFSFLEASTQVSQDTGSSTPKLDDCAFCRDASSLRVIMPLLLVHWQPVLVYLLPSFSLVTAASFESAAVSPRAPPAF